MNHPLGQACALLTAIMWAFAVVLFKLSGERTAPLALNLFKSTVGILLLGVTLGGLLLGRWESLESLQTLAASQVVVLLLSGFIGIAVADTLFFHALNLIGVGLISIVDCSYAPCVILFSWLMLGESLTAYHYAGAALVLVGVFTAERHTLPAHRSTGQIIGGMVLATAAVALMAFGIVWATPTLHETTVVWGTILRVAGGFGGLVLLTLAWPGWRTHWRVFRPSVAWRAAVPASVLGTYFCMLLWIAGFKYTYASIAGVLNQTSVVVATILAAVFLKERFGARQVAALVLALAGVVVLTFGDKLETLLWAVQPGAPR
jgi:drug/metabolite transporter (DMT)-like permease